MAGGLITGIRQAARTEQEARAGQAERTGPVARLAAGSVLPPGTRAAALAVLCVSVLIVNLDNTILNVALPTLARDLSAGPSDLQWIVDSYMIVFAGLLLTAGSLADRVGRKRTFLAGLALFAAGSASATFSGSVGLLIAARAGMGVGGALMIPSTLSIITDMYRDPRERQRAISMWAATTGVGVALGPIMGGLLLAHFWWGSVFLVNVPIAVAGLAAGAWLVPDSRNPEALSPDLPGTVLSIAGITLMLWAIIEGPTKGWSSPLVLGAGAAGLAVLATFAILERYSSHPMLHMGFFRDRAFGAAIPSVMTVNFGLFGALFVLTQFMQFSLGYSPLAAGVRVLPAAAAVTLIAPLSAVGVRFLGPKVTMACGLALIAAGLWLVSGVTVSTGYGGIVAGMVALGAGAGLALPTSSGSVVGSVPRQHAGVASATNTTAIQVGGATGVAVVGSLLSTRYTNDITASLSRAATAGQAGTAGQPLPHAAVTAIQGSLGGALAVAARLPGAAGQLLAHAARSAFASGLDLGMLTAAGVAAGGFLVAVTWLPRRAR
jgi:EmrB/QacA subfamily drug resistance transporter